MAYWKVATFTRWTTIASVNHMAVALAYPCGDWGQESGWTDIVGQTDAQINSRPIAYATMALGKLDDATLAALQANTHYLLLARWEADAETPSFDNRENVVTTAQRNAFVAYFSAEFGIDVSRIPVVANSVGRTRRAVLRDIVFDLRERLAV